MGDADFWREKQKNAAIPFISLLMGRNGSSINLSKFALIKKRKALDHEIDRTLAEIQKILGIEIDIEE